MRSAKFPHRLAYSPAVLLQVDTFATLLRFSKGYTGTVNATYAASTRRFEINICGKEGQVSIGRSAADDGTQGYLVKTTTSHYASSQFLPFSGVESEIRAFVHLCLESEHHTPIAANLLSAEEAFKDLAVIEAIVETQTSLTPVQTL